MRALALSGLLIALAVLAWPAALTLSLALTAWIHTTRKDASA